MILIPLPESVMEPRDACNVTVLLLVSVTTGAARVRLPPDEETEILPPSPLLSPVIVDGLVLPPVMVAICRLPLLAKLMTPAPVLIARLSTVLGGFEVFRVTSAPAITPRLEAVICPVTVCETPKWEKSPTRPLGREIAASTLMAPVAGRLTFPGSEPMPKSGALKVAVLVSVM